jgi:hypothetical protein
MSRARTIFIWTGLAAAIGIPLAAAASSPLLAWRSPIYIGAGFAGILAMLLLLVQPLLARQALPGLSAWQARRTHRMVGSLLVIAVVVHVAGLWITSPPDVIDALLFASPTPFSAWGVIAMWALFATAGLAVFRRTLHVRLWRRGHKTLAIIIVGCSVVHALLIEGTMEPLSKALLCVLVIGVTLVAVLDLRVLARQTRPR